jgi:5-formyltetrahydrofolate cyclo-ligase
MLEFRNGKPKQELDELSIKIVHQLLDLNEMKQANTLCTYLSTCSEVRTFKIVKWALSTGKRVIVPIVDKTEDQLCFSEIENPEVELAKGTFGILEPKREYRRLMPLERADVILVPRIAWDLRGYRVGYGHGFYDKSINALKRVVLKIGLAYEFQIIEKLPTSQYDRKVDFLVTEHRIIKPEV